MPDYQSPLVVSNALIGVVFTLVLLWAILGTAFRLAQWIKTPSPLPIPLTPAPRTRVGVIGRLFIECFGFRSLARASKITWLASMLFHYGLLLVLLMHLRFIFPLIPAVLVPFVVMSGWAALAMIIGLAILFIRRVFIDRLRYISAPSDYLHLLLLLAIALSGVGLKRVWSVDTYAVATFVKGALTFQWAALPSVLSLWVHLVFVVLLLLVFPISKLVHGVGIVFSPTLNQRDTSVREGEQRSRARKS